MRRFHSYGPVDPKLHFYVPRDALVQRCVDHLVGESNGGGSFFTIWAPRQSGKTWLMRQAQERIKALYGDRFTLVSLTLQRLMKKREPDEAFLQRIPRRFSEAGITCPELSSFEDWPLLFRKNGGLFDRPLLLLIDEVDSLTPSVLDTLVGLFRQIYLRRDAYFLHGLALVGVRAVLGMESDQGSPFNVQRGIHVPNLTKDEVREMFVSYQQESGQPIEPLVIDRLYGATRGQPGLVGWFGELLTDTYNPGKSQTITVANWEQVYRRACATEPNNTVLNLLSKARRPRYRNQVAALFQKSNIPFSLDRPWCNYLYLNGVIDEEEIVTKGGESLHVCRFSSPFIQHRLYQAFSFDMADLSESSALVPVLPPNKNLTEVLTTLNIPTLLSYYQDYLNRLKASGYNPFHGHPSRADLHLREAVGHFHLYYWLTEACARLYIITPEFPTGNGKVDLHLRYQDQSAVIEVKSFTTQAELPVQKEQVARYAKSRGLKRATLALFVPTADPSTLSDLSQTEAIPSDNTTVEVTTVALSAL